MARLPRHPWDVWFARKRFTLLRGRDYDGMTHSMAQSIRNKAASRKYQIKVSVRVKEDPERVEVEVLGGRRAAHRT